MRIDVRHAFRPRRNSVRCAQVMDCFGIGFERGSHVIADGLDLPIQPGDVVLFTGPSGSGKSSLMRAVADAQSNAAGQGDEPRAACERPALIVDINALPLEEQSLIDAFALPVDETMHLLSSCGLGEAHLMLRTPSELSDGQRYRFRLALGLAARPDWLLADEFTATLDRTLAKVVANNVRRLCDRTGSGFLLATTHEDLAADLDPDVHVQCRLDGEIGVRRRAGPDVSAAGDLCKKKEGCRSPGSCGSARRPSATGRTSRGGIIAVTRSE
ncbi:MAG: ATP-binding cassette domain-containing protein [Planctomycetaceae bacterium]|nr:ATP-binding cassette domain-containing protein [Planctomycetaceae bacterium]